MVLYESKPAVSSEESDIGCTAEGNEGKRVRKVEMVVGKRAVDAVASQIKWAPI
jgi:hypothetical protein